MPGSNAKYAQFLIQYLETHSAAYGIVPSAEINVVLVSEEIRPASCFYRFELSTEDVKYPVLAKIPLLRDENVTIHGNKPSSRRPSLVPKTEEKVKYKLEYSALSAIRDFFIEIDDARFGAIPILDFIPEYHAIIMKEVRQPNLKKLFARKSRLHFPFAPIELDTVFRNAGAWLRLFHQLPKKDDVQVRHARREDFIETIDHFKDFLVHELQDEPFFQAIVPATILNAHKRLPELLPMGLGHGDYAMRNILVGPHARVTVLDTLARWRAPIYEDIAYFLVNLRTTWPQVLTQGMAFSKDDLDRYEHEFLSGYFEQEGIPYLSIRLFEIQALLDKWSALVVLLKGGHKRFSSIFNYVRFISMNSYFRAVVRSLLQEVHKVPAAEKEMNGVSAVKHEYCETEIP
ncbi:MAG: aminoglycoside phosphotransferase family protein [Anaerolineales bacterium]|jgi:aminoglycoside phosphotransferase (APT) family kinase protein